jgi:NTE family protein
LRKRVKINLALQGGGAHGAFTWGVLDRLLEDPHIDFGWISATSAGSVNAVALVSGLLEGTREHARHKLFKIWEAVNKAGIPDLGKINPFLAGLSRPNSMSQIATMWSPYEFNPLGFDPLRQLLTDHVDFEAIRKRAEIELLVAATHVGTGRCRLFRRHELSVEVVLASACLPTLHHAVEIDGAAYWDGGYSANPDLVTLASESPVGDTLLVMVSPRNSDTLPKTARDIANHTTRLTFNAPLMRDVEIIGAVRETAGTLLPKGRLAPLARHRFHVIDGGRVTGSLDPETTVTPDWDVMTYLHGAGRDYTEKWLTSARRSVGRSETVNLARHFFPPIAAAEDIYAFALRGPVKGRSSAVRKA